MQHFPIFLDLSNQHVALSGGGEAALAKLRLLLKTEARLSVFASSPSAEIEKLAASNRITLTHRQVTADDLQITRLVYAANEDADLDKHVAALARSQGVLSNIVDNLVDSDFITPAIVDRDPVTVAIGTEGAAPVLARLIKADLEERLPTNLGLLARAGKSFRKAVEVLPMGRKRRAFWSAYYSDKGPKTLAGSGPTELHSTLAELLDTHITTAPKEGHVDLVGAGPGDPELLTLKARNALSGADVVIHDRLVAPKILELARREAVIINAGKQGFGTSMDQGAINEQIVEHGLKGLHVVRLKGGDPAIFGRLDEELTALTEAGISYSVIPGITSASAAAAQIGQSLTQRGRNSSLRILTGHDTEGFCDHDWQTLARPGEVAAIYMGKRSARFIQGRLLMHGADQFTPVTIVENASRADSQILATTLSKLEPDLTAANFAGPAIVLFGLAPRAAISALPQIQLQEAKL